MMNVQDCTKCCRLKQDFFEPSASIDLHIFRLVDIYTRASLPEMNEEVLMSFKQPESKLRIVIATLAFFMGIDCPNIRQIIYFGQPNPLEEYVKETGSAGRDCCSSEAILINVTNRYTERKIKDYCENTICCRRKLL